MKDTLLIVDDEKSIIDSLVRMFRKEDIEIFKATSGADGLKIIEEEEISLVISDHGMPHMSGVDFLAQLKEISPDTIRIMLTGYADLQAAVDAINKGEVYRFISKPWNDEELLMIVRQSLEYRNILMQNRQLSRTVKRQSSILNKLEGQYPGISDVTRGEDGNIILEDDDLDDISLDRLIDGL